MKHFGNKVIVSADHYFEDPSTGEYRFDPSKLPQAHGACLRDFAHAVDKRRGTGDVVIVRGVPGSGKSTLALGDTKLVAADRPVIIVDNTSVTVAEVAPYAALALAFGMKLTIITVKCDPKTAHGRNTHGVPLHAVERMAAALDSEAARFPPWWEHVVIQSGESK